MQRLSQRTPVTTLAILLVLWVGSGPVRAHVDYVTDNSSDQIDPLTFVIEVLSNSTNLALVVGSGAIVVTVLVLYFIFSPRVQDVVVLREVLASYDDLIPWMLRLSVGLPLVGAGFIGYLFSPSVPFEQGGNQIIRLLLIGLGFLTLFGLATRIVSTIGLLAYLGTLFTQPNALLAVEYIPCFLALMVLGGGRPSADHMLQQVASTEGTLYGRIDPVHRLKQYLDESTAPYRQYVPLILRVGMGVSFIYLGLVQKLANPAQTLQVVSKYDLTQVVPVDPGLWVLGAGFAEVAVGSALVVGFLTRANAAVAFVLFTLTLFGLPDDPVLAHVSLFGMASAVFVMGAGPLSFDDWYSSLAVFDSESVVPGD